MPVVNVQVEVTEHLARLLEQAMQSDSIGAGISFSDGLDHFSLLNFESATESDAMIRIDDDRPKSGKVRKHEITTLVQGNDGTMVLIDRTTIAARGIVDALRMYHDCFSHNKGKPVDNLS